MINVVNKSKHKPTENDFYIGRGSVMGNPYHTKESNHPQALYKVETTEEAIIGFEKYLDDQIKQGNKEIVNFVNFLVEREIYGEETNLVCFCSPDPCHGHPIRNYVIELVDNIKWGFLYED